MIDIKKAKHTGFCFGVKRAVDIAQRALKEGKIYSLGPLIHNPLVVEDFSRKGLEIINDIGRAKGARILIRSHGISPKLRQRILENKIGTVDATCPFLEKTHKIIDSLKRNGYFIVIVGEKRHPEVLALADAAGKKSTIVSSTRDAKELDYKNKKIALVAQSTLTESVYREVASVISKRVASLKVLNTICRDVARRQEEAVGLARDVDVVIVIGGKISANTRRLAKLCRATGVKTYHIETEKDLNNKWFNDCASAGVVSGTSTPDRVVDKVIAKIKQMTNQKLKNRPAR